MSEVDTASTQEQSQDIGMSAGQLLREARESRQMSIEGLASALKVPVAKLQALEGDRWDMLTDTVFARALALSVCRVLQIESAPLLALLPKAEAAKLSTNPEGINAPFKEKTLRSSMSSSGDSHGGHTAKLLAVVLIAAVGAAVLYFLPKWEGEAGADATVNAQERSDVSVVLPEPLVVAAPAVPAAQPQAEVVVDVTPALAAPVAAPVVAAPVVAAPAAVDARQTTAVVPAAPAQVNAPAAEKPVDSAVTNVSNPAQPRAEPLLRFTATGETWVQVRNAQQQVVMERILKAGDVYEATAAGRPLQVVVGNTDVTKLEIDGAAWNLAASARNNVARFEVK